MNVYDVNIKVNKFVGEDNVKSETDFEILSVNTHDIFGFIVQD